MLLMRCAIPDALEHFLHALLALGRRHACAVRQRKLDVFKHGQIANQVERLKDRTRFSRLRMRVRSESDRFATALRIDPVVAAVAFGESSRPRNREQRG